MLRNIEKLIFHGINSPNNMLVCDASPYRAQRTIAWSLCAMIIKKDSILYRTNQAWKYRMTLVSIWPISILFCMGFLYSTSEWQYLTCVTVAGVLALLALFISFTIQCPACKSRWWWQALKRPLHSRSLQKFTSQTSCPACGFSNDNIT